MTRMPLGAMTVLGLAMMSQGIARTQIPRIQDGRPREEAGMQPHLRVGRARSSYQSDGSVRRLLDAEGNGEDTTDGVSVTLGAAGTGEGPQPSLHAEADREYLNGLLQATVMDTDSQVADVVFVKTHKTASTTVAALLYRYSARHNLQLAHFGEGTYVSLQSAAAETKKSGQLVDIFHYHISMFGRYRGTWDKAVKYYREIMRHPDRINYITALREPRAHLLSYYYFYVQPENQLSIEEFLAGTSSGNHNILFNTLSAHFGLQTAKQMDSFISGVLPHFKMVLLTERLDESLLVLRRMLGWHMIDVTYFNLNTAKAGAHRYDGKPLVRWPQFDTLPLKVQKQIDDLTVLDRALYEAGKKEFEKRLAPYSGSMDQDMAEFQELQRVTREYLGGNSSSLAINMYKGMQTAYRDPQENFPF